jgi:molecular chaperone DnaK
MDRKISHPSIVKFSRENPNLSIVPGQDEDAYIECSTGRYSPSMIAAIILRALTEKAEGHCGYHFSRAVVTVPASYDNAQREATKLAGRLAGLRLINEPTSAALASIWQRPRNGTILIYDFGGGTFEVSVAASTSGALEILSTSSDSNLGGDDIDSCIQAYSTCNVSSHQTRECRSHRLCSPGRDYRQQDY